MLFLPIAASTASKPLFNEFERLGTEFEGLSIVAMEFGIKSTIFDEYLLKDARLMGLGAFFVFVCLWVYTASIFVTVMTIMSVFIVLTATYFLYEVVYAVHFFPFMNLLSIIICIGMVCNTFSVEEDQIFNCTVFKGWGLTTRLYYVRYSDQRNWRCPIIRTCTKSCMLLLSIPLKPCLLLP